MFSSVAARLGLEVGIRSNGSEEIELATYLGPESTNRSSLPEAFTETDSSQEDITFSPPLEGNFRLFSRLGEDFTHLNEEIDQDPFFSDENPLPTTTNIPNTTSPTHTASIPADSSDAFLQNWNDICAKYRVTPTVIPEISADSSLVREEDFIDFEDFINLSNEESEHSSDNEERTDSESANENSALLVSEDDFKDDDDYSIDPAAQEDDGFEINRTASADAPPTKTMMRTILDNTKDDIFKSLNEWKYEFEHFKSQLSHERLQLLKSAAPALLALATTGQPVFSAFMNVSGKPPAEVEEAWEKMNSGERFYSIVNAVSSFVVNYPFNYKILLECGTKLKENALETIKHPKYIFYPIFTLTSALSGGIANGAITYETFIILAKYLDGLIPGGLGLLATISNFTSRWTGIIRALRMIKNMLSPDARLQIEMVNKLIDELNLDYVSITGKRLEEELDSSLDELITLLLQEKREFNETDLLQVIEAEEKVLLQIISDRVKKVVGAKKYELNSFEELLNFNYLTIPIHEQTRIMLDSDIAKVERIIEQCKLYLDFKQELLNSKMPISEKIICQRDLFKVFKFIKPTPTFNPIRLKDDEDTHNFHVIPEPVSLETIYEAGYKETLNKHTERYIHGNLNDKDYDRLFRIIIAKVEATRTKHPNVSINQTDSPSALNANSIFHERSPYKTPKEWLTGASRLLAAVIFGIAGGGVYLQKAFDGTEDLKKLLDGKSFTKDQLNQWERAGIGLPGGFASAMLYGISAADFPKLIFIYLKEVVRSKSLFQWSKAVLFLATNFFASASMQNVTAGVLSADGILDLVKDFLSLGIFNEEQTKLLAPYIVRLGGGLVNMVPLLRNYEAHPAVNPNRPTIKEVLQRFGDVNNNPLGEKALRGLHQARDLWAQPPAPSSSPNLIDDNGAQPPALPSSPAIVGCVSFDNAVDTTEKRPLNRSNQNIMVHT